MHKNNLFQLSKNRFAYDNSNNLNHQLHRPLMNEFPKSTLNSIGCIDPKCKRVNCKGMSPCQICNELFHEPKKHMRVHGI
ncbi:unnamed protein product [Brachionus calyciflorus]|uniref:Uncharacterized protein n=1 Tax=Brachionus calyciflorus TaxID=104777 RepID=A0A814I8H0_9BILA|nr:unnamed protein product [Brachionus calyciflorus]